MRIHGVLIASAAYLTLTGCASIISDSQMNMTVDSDPQGAKCTLRNKEGRYLVTTPGTIPVDTTCSPLTIVCEKDGYKTIQRELDYSHKGAAWGNIILGGGIGYLVDRGTGAACEYPQSMTISLDEKSG